MINTKAGRPDKFTPQTRKKILDYISKFVPYKVAAEASGICEDTFYHWRERGKADQEAGLDTEYAKFSEQLAEVEAGKICQHTKNIEDHSEKKWEASAWFLERRWYKYFSPNNSVIEFNKRMEEMEKRNGKVDGEGKEQTTEE